MSSPRRQGLASLARPVVAMHITAHSFQNGLQAGSLLRHNADVRQDDQGLLEHLQPQPCSHISLNAVHGHNKALMNASH